MNEKNAPEHIPDEPTIRFLNHVVRMDARVLAAIIVIVIVCGIADVVDVLYLRLMAPPYMLLEINDILATFGAFMAVLIAIDICQNIILYVHEHRNQRRAEPDSEPSQGTTS